MTVRSWREEPQYREATFEYDPTMYYDYNDLTDRSIVTHYLCTQTTDKAEKLDLLAALVWPGEVPA